MKKPVSFYYIYTSNTRTCLTAAAVAALEACYFFTIFICISTATLDTKQHVLNLNNFWQGIFEHW